jgi:hypothetical protein
MTTIPTQVCELSSRKQLDGPNTATRIGDRTTTEPFFEQRRRDQARNSPATGFDSRQFQLNQTGCEHVFWDWRGFTDVRADRDPHCR